MDLKTVSVDKDSNDRILLGLILFRLMTITVLLGSTAILNIRQDADWTPVQFIIFSSIGVSYLLSILYLLALKYNTNYHFQALAQLVGDLLFWSCLIYLTGGLHSPFTFLYSLSIIHGSIALGKRGAAFAFTFAAISFCVLVLMEHYQIFHLWLQITASFQSFWDLNEIYHFFLNICMFFLTTVLAAYLARQMEMREAIMARQSMTLETQRMLNRSIMLGIQSGFILLNDEGRITFFNLASERFSEWSSAEATGRMLDDVFPALREALEKEIAREDWDRFVEFSIEREEESKRWIAATFSDLIGVNNERKGSILILDDITNRHNLEELAARNQKLAAIGELAAGIAHEIRNPLASISGSIQLLQSELPPDDENGKLMEISLRETDRLNTLIGDFLAYARPNPLSTQLVFIHEMMEDLVELIGGDPKFGDVRIRIEYAPWVPQLIGDNAKIRQILWNILKNAVESVLENPTGVVWVSVEGITVLERPEGEGVRFRIRDNGTGMSPETRAKIFDPFFTTKEDGTGLGMAIVYQLVKSHQGEITVDSKPGRGTEFTISLPCRPSLPPTAE